MKDDPAFIIPEKVRKMSTSKNARYIASPSRNFCVLNSQIMNDPTDGKDKLMFTSFVAGGTGIFAIVDPATDKGERFDLPCDNGAWAVCRLNERYLLIGTCAERGAVHVFDFFERKFVKTSFVEKSTYVWNLVKASDGNVYGGTYNTNFIVKVDKETLDAKVVARCDDCMGNLYSRTTYTDVNGSGNIIVAAGMKEPEVCVYNIYEEKVIKNIPGKITKYYDNYFCVKKDGDTALKYFDSATCEPIEEKDLPAPVSSQRDRSLLSDGSRAFMYKQGYKYISPEGKEEIRSLPVLPPATGMLTIKADDNGKIWGASGFGQTICCLDPDSGEFYNTNVVCDRGGEVYGIVPYEDRIYLTAYSGGMHIVYYPDKPWSQENNENPNMFRYLVPEDFIRPDTRSYLGPKGYIYTGFSEEYGTYGGAITRLDPKTNEVKFWKNDYNDFAFAHLIFDRDYIYAVTHSGGNGLPARRGVPTYLFKLDSELNLISVDEIGSVYIYGKVYRNGKTFVTGIKDGKCFFLVHKDGEASHTIKEINRRAIEMDELYGTDKLVFFDGPNVYTIDENGDNIELVAELPRNVSHLTSCKNGRVFVCCEADVYEIEF